MGLVRCPGCGNEISNKAEICPNCQLPVRDRRIKKYETFMVDSWHSDLRLIQCPDCEQIFDCTTFGVPNKACPKCGRPIKLPPAKQLIWASTLLFAPACAFGVFLLGIAIPFFIIGDTGLTKLAKQGSFLSVYLCAIALVGLVLAYPISKRLTRKLWNIGFKLAYLMEEKIRGH